MTLLREVFMTIQTDYKTEYGFNPWKRYFARVVDFTVYEIIIISIYVFGLRSEIFLSSNPFISFISSTLPLIILTLILEPILIATFSTTFGKFLFGIRIRDYYGGKVTYKKSYKRTLGALWSGFGFGIPILSLVMLIRSFLKVNKQESLDYDYDFSYEVRNTKIVRKVGILATVAISCFVVIVSVLYIETPINRGDLTLLEYVENFNYFAEKQGTDYYLDSEGQPQYTPLPEGTARFYLTGDNGNPPELPRLDYEIVDGYVQKVSFDITITNQPNVDNYGWLKLVITRSLNSDIGLFSVFNNEIISLYEDLRNDISNYNTAFQGGSVTFEIESSGDYSFFNGVISAKNQNEIDENDFVRQSFAVSKTH